MRERRHVDHHGPLATESLPERLAGVPISASDSGPIQSSTLQCTRPAGPPLPTCWQRWQRYTCAQRLFLPEPSSLLYRDGMGRSDRITILLSVAALCVTIIGTSCSTNARIGDVNARINDVSARIDDVNTNVNARIDELREDIRELRALVIDAIKVDVPAAD